MNIVRNGQAGFSRTSMVVQGAVKRHIVPTQNNSPYQLGKQAFVDGKKKDENPFHNGDSYDEWGIGWEGAAIAAATEDEAFA